MSPTTHRHPVGDPAQSLPVFTTIVYPDQGWVRALARRVEQAPRTPRVVRALTRWYLIHTTP